MRMEDLLLEKTLYDIKYKADILSDAIVGYQHGKILASYISVLRDGNPFEMPPINIERALEEFLNSIPEDVIVDLLRSRGYTVING